MAAKQPQRTKARKVKDKWRSKEWYRILAPDMFNNAQISETLGDEGGKVMGRITEVTMQDITGDFSKMHIKLQFKISDITGFDAHTQFVGHSLTSDYIRRLTRRKHSKTDGVFDVLTKDKALIRVKPMAVTEKRIQVSQQQAIRSIMGDIINNQAKHNISSEFIKEMLSGDMSKDILKACKPIYPLKRVEIRKSEVLRLPTEKVIEEPKEEAREEPEGADEPKGEEIVKGPSPKQNALPSEEELPVEDLAGQESEELGDE